MKKIAVRFGHQTTGADGGAVGYVKETDVNRRYGVLLINKLKTLGYDVLNVTPPEANRSLSDSLYYGINMANNWGAELFVSCHVNANVTTNQPMGCEVVCSGSGTGLTYATKISNELANLGFKNRGAKGDERGLAEIRGTNMPCVICEPFFLDSSADIFIYNKVGDEGIANAIVKAITGQSVSSSTSSVSTDTPISITKDATLKQMISALQYNLNLDFNAKLSHVDGNIYQETLDALNGIKGLLVKGSKSNIVLWLKQRMVLWNYCKYTGKLTNEFDEILFQGITNLQKNWSRPTDGILRLETWSIFLNNK